MELNLNTTISGRWWVKKNKHEAVFALVKYLDQYQSDRKTKNLRHARLYANSELLGLESGNYMESSKTSMFADRDSRIRLNVISSVVDTISSKIAKNKPKVVLLPSGGDWSLQQRGKKLEKFIDGLFYKADLHDEATKAFLDCCIFGTGAIKVFQDGGNLCAERVLPSELIIDDEEAFRGHPRQLHQKRDVSREVLKEMFPESKLFIETATKLQKHYGLGTLNSIADNVTVIESWHLPSIPGATDGKHLISVDTGVLLEEPYECDDFPFAFLRWKKPVVGFWGIGIAEDIVGLQIEINKLLMKIQLAFHFLSNPMIFLDQGSAISKAHINNKIGIIVPYRGKEPTIRAAQTVHPEVFTHLERLYAKAFEIAGVSQLSATSKKPEGLESGTALREYNNIESERFALVAQNYEQMYINIAEKMIRVAKELYTDETNLEVTVKGKKFIESIKWSQVDMDEDQFALIISAASSLPDSRAGRVQVATEWLTTENITNEEWRELIDIPDLQESTDLIRGPHDYIKQSIEKILADGKYVEPEAMDDLEYAMKYAVLSYQKAKQNNAPDDRLELLRLYIDAVSRLTDDMKAEAVEEQMKLNEYAQQLQPPVPVEAPAPVKVPEQPIQGMA